MGITGMTGTYLELWRQRSGVGAIEERSSQETPWCPASATHLDAPCLQHMESLTARRHSCTCRM